MKFNRLIKTIFLSEFVKGLYLALKFMFKPKATINYPFETGIAHEATGFADLSISTKHILQFPAIDNLS